jgi:hypothetical protein
LQGHVGHSGISADCDLHLNMKLADLDLTKCVPLRFCLCNVTIFSAFSFIFAWSGLIVWVPGVFNLFFTLHKKASLLLTLHLFFSGDLVSEKHEVE